MPAIHAYAAKGAKQKLEPFDYDPGALGAEEVEAKRIVRALRMVHRRYGAFADRVRVHWRFAIPLPDAIASEFAGPLMCAGTTVFSPMLHFNVTPGMRAVVVGIGGLGHLALQYLEKFGCDVTAISSSHGKEEEARTLGANHFIATKDQGAMAKAKRSFDFILATISGGVNWPEYVDALRPRGQLVIVGALEAEVKAPIASLLPEKSIRGGRTGSPADTAKMLDFTARHGIKPMIETFPFKEVNAAVDRLRSGKARYRVVLVA